MPKATAVWLVENTKISFKQIADFCNLHELEVKGIADGDVAKGIVKASRIFAFVEREWPTMWDTLAPYKDIRSLHQNYRKGRLEDGSLCANESFENCFALALLWSGFVFGGKARLAR